MAMSLEAKGASLRVGIYRHYKHTDSDPRYYQILGVGRHTETEEHGVVYIPLYPAPGPRLQFRPLDDFMSSVVVNDVTLLRFVYIGVSLPT